MTLDKLRRLVLAAWLVLGIAVAIPTVWQAVQHVATGDLFKLSLPSQARIGFGVGIVLLYAASCVYVGLEALRRGTIRYGLWLAISVVLALYSITLLAAELRSAYLGFPLLAFALLSVVAWRRSRR